MFKKTLLIIGIIAFSAMASTKDYFGTVKEVWKPNADHFMVKIQLENSTTTKDVFYWIGNVGGENDWNMMYSTALYSLASGKKTRVHLADYGTHSNWAHQIQVYSNYAAH